MTPGMSYKIVDGGILVSENVIEIFKYLDVIIFDCDGTLVSVFPSFQVMAKVIPMIYLDQLYGITCKLGDDFDEVFYLLRMLRGFNNVRVLIAILLQVLFLSSEAAKPKKRIFGKNRPGILYFPIRKRQKQA